MLAARNDRIRQVTLRLPEGVLRQARQTANRRHLSLNALLRDALERMAEEERQEALSAAYDSLGADPESNVESFVHAQREALRRG